jgi:transposase
MRKATSCSTGTVPNDAEKLGDVLVGFEPGTPVVFEATYGWAWLAELLHEMGFEAHLAHPAACKAIASARLKNDKVDARTLAQLLRVDLLGEAWIAPRPVREVRLLLRHRAALVRLRTTLKTRVRAVLADRGVEATDGLWDGRGGGGWKGSSCLTSSARSSTTCAPCSTALTPSSPAWNGSCGPGPSPTLESKRCSTCPGSAC